jgi:hypothetical protein
MVFDECPLCGVRKVDASELTNVGRGSDRWTIVQCKACQGYVFVHFDGGAIAEMYPNVGLHLPNVPGLTPALREDVLEAGRALGGGCYRASAVMSRRALQRLLKNKGARNEI